VHPGLFDLAKLRKRLPQTPIGKGLWEVCDKGPARKDIPGGTEQAVGAAEGLEARKGFRRRKQFLAMGIE
jgi:hypothetical protein